MSIARVYRMVSVTNEAESLRRTLVTVIEIAKKLPGCEGAMLLRDTEHLNNFILIEQWTSIDAHKAGLASFPQEALAPLGAVLASPPEGTYMEYLS